MCTGRKEACSSRDEHARNAGQLVAPFTGPSAHTLGQSSPAARDACCWAGLIHPPARQ